MKKMSNDRSSPPLRVAAVGLRGIPNVEGGIESHAQSLYELLARAGFEVTVHARNAFVADKKPHSWRGVRIVPSWSPSKAGAEALVHTFIAILKARFEGADLLHIHAVGPALLTPMARLLGFRVVVTHHGRDYEREKWGPVAKFLLKMGERFSARYAHRVICVARNDADRLNRKYGPGTAAAIPNGAPKLAPADSPSVLQGLGLVPNRYVINVARLVPEKRQLDLIAAFGRLAPRDWKLVFVGSALNESEYPGIVEAAAARTPGCIMCGTRGGSELSTLYAGAGVYVLPSAHEGLPITLLEALSFGLPCIASDIPANREVRLGDDCYFPVGDVAALAGVLDRALRAAEAQPPGERASPGQRLELLPPEFQWQSVAEATGRVLLEAAGRPASHVVDSTVGGS
jgi:glycosyltransferase involved in cell wall biosynthesis